MSENLPVLAIVGRPNVGKSTLFNRLVGRRRAIVDDIPGVTRDRNYGTASYNNYEFLAIDTGGFEPESKENLLPQMRQQAQLAVEEADAVLFMVDTQEGWISSDEEVYRILSRSSKPLYVVASKADNQRLSDQSSEFYQLGVEEVYPVSAQQNNGITELLNVVHLRVNLDPRKQQDESRGIRVAVVGKPNAGKSSLVNSLMHANRMIVDSVAGTTRDSVDSICRYHGQDFVLVDTAGIRRKAKVSQKLETYSIVSALKAIERSEVVLLVVDALEGVTEQVMRVAGYANDRQRALVIVMNKWDLVEKHSATLEQVRERVYEQLYFINFAPIIFVSALTNQRTGQIFEKVLEVYEQYNRRVQTSDLNAILEMVVSQHPPPAKGGRPTKIYFGSQVQVAPPTFVLMTNNLDKTNRAYERYLSRQLRSHFGFAGVPLTLVWRKRESNRVPHS